jgi:hypothetical protein
MDVDRRQNPRRRSAGRRAEDQEYAEALADCAEEIVPRTGPGRRKDDYVREHSHERGPAWLRRLNLRWIAAWGLTTLFAFAGLLRAEDTRDHNDKVQRAAIEVACRDVDELRSSVLDTAMRQRVAVRAIARLAPETRGLLVPIVTQAQTQINDLTAQRRNCERRAIDALLRQLDN